jgi:peptidoglycan/xylan/chitin deacetylase (PgdA/CDA1 family)
MDLERGLDYRSSFNFVFERYRVSPELRRQIEDAGFEVGVHGLKHDGRLFESKAIFQERAPRINQYLADWGAVGFRAPAMHHNLEWILQLNLEYDLSTFDTDPFEPQPWGVETIFPFWVSGRNGEPGYLEMPYTLPQDFTLFVVMREHNIDLWRRKLDWVVAKGGMALVNTHPDYMCMKGRKPDLEEYPVEKYLEFLEYVRAAYGDRFWNALPREVARYCSPHLSTEREKRPIHSW